MGGKWKTYSFADLISSIVDNRGKTCPTDKGGVPLIATNCVKNAQLFPVFEKIRYVNPETYKTWFRGHPQPEDIIFVCKGSPGNVCWTPDPVNFCIAQDMVAIRADSKIVDPKFLFALLRSPETQEKIQNMHVGTLIPHFKKGDFKNLYLNVPEDKLIQKTIGKIYFDFCHKIELNRQMNETLEAMARAIFTSWFVDFDPVRAKAEGRPTGLPEEIAALFPDSFEDSELGEIPKGWEVKSIGSDFHLTMGQSPPGTTYNEMGDGLPFFQGRRDFGFRYPSNRVYCTAPKRVAERGDTLVSVRAPVGDINMAIERCCVGRGIAGVRHKSASRSYTYYAMHTLNEKFGQFEGEGTVFGSINKNQFEELSWLSPGDNLVNEFEKVVFAFDEKVERNINEISTLTALRDTLLPKLISGELCIPDAERFIEEVAYDD